MIAGYDPPQELVWNSFSEHAIGDEACKFGEEPCHDQDHQSKHHQGNGLDCAVAKLFQLGERIAEVPDRFFSDRHPVHDGDNILSFGSQVCGIRFEFCLFGDSGYERDTIFNFDVGGVVTLGCFQDFVQAAGNLFIPSDGINVDFFRCL